MIWLNSKEPSVINVNKDLVLKYKRTADDCFINIKRWLSRQCVYFILYTDLQEVLNQFGSIIDKLLNEEYTEVNDWNKDDAQFSRLCKAFLKGCEGFVDDITMEGVTKEVDSLLLCVQKLKYIIDNLCLDAEDSFSNEIRSIF